MQSAKGLEQRHVEWPAKENSVCLSGWLLGMPGGSPTGAGEGTHGSAGLLHAHPPPCAETLSAHPGSKLGFQAPPMLADLLAQDCSSPPPHQTTSRFSLPSVPLRTPPTHRPPTPTHPPTQPHLCLLLGSAPQSQPVSICQVPPFPPSLLLFFQAPAPCTPEFSGVLQDVHGTSLFFCPGNAPPFSSRSPNSVSRSPGNAPPFPSRPPKSVSCNSAMHPLFLPGLPQLSLAVLAMHLLFLPGPPNPKLPLKLLPGPPPPPQHPDTRPGSPARPPPSRRWCGCCSWKGTVALSGCSPARGELPAGAGGEQPRRSPPAAPRPGPQAPPPLPPAAAPAITRRPILPASAPTASPTTAPQPPLRRLICPTGRRPAPSAQTSDSPRELQAPPPDQSQDGSAPPPRLIGPHA